LTIMTSDKAYGLFFLTIIALELLGSLLWRRFQKYPLENKYLKNYQSYFKSRRMAFRILLFFLGLFLLYK
ncbi:MAG: hypothetical protein ACXVBQ_15610, partial [Pseudobdellovibrionaceae bacterium]